MGLRSETPPEVMAELCRVYLAWVDAPEVEVEVHDTFATATWEPDVLVGKRVKLVETEQ